MSDAENVGLWLGIIVGIAGVVLAIVAIWFATRVDDRSSRVNNQTIQSLQKIETTVEKMSSDTTGLVKAAWDKLLGQVGPSAYETTSAQDIVSGISSEARADLEEQPGVTPEEIKRLESVIEDVRSSIHAQISSLQSPTRASSRIDFWVDRLNRLSDTARALVQAISDEGWHLSRKEYRALINSEIFEAVRELREAGVLVPYSGKSRTGEEAPVYFLPSDLQAIQIALQLSERTTPTASQTVRSLLERIGYPRDKPSDEPGGKSS
jgi:hypothetical protein